ncbi:glycosyltransferase family 4 protein [candidate division KSB1 bacterium]|nr:glycosyltransferase family 4 protein [candidate division KSB1 bacterium]
MKIAYFEELLNLVPNGGMAVWANRLVHYLNSNGIQADKYSFSDIASRIPDTMKKYPNFREVFIYPYLGKKLLSRIENEYDLIHVVSPHTLALHNKKKPIVTTVQYLISRQVLMLGKHLPDRYKLFFNSLSYHLFLKSEIMGMKKADLITVQRKDYKKYLMEQMNIPEEKIRIIKYGIDHLQFQPSSNGTYDEDIVLFVGRGSLPKGFDTLVKAAKHIKSKIIAVASQIPSELRDKIAALDNFEVIPKIDQSEIPRLYQRASVFVMPSLTESSPLVTMEAMACGLPVVCTSEGSGEHIEDGINGYIIPFKDDEQLVEKVNFLLAHKEVAKRFGQYNRHKVERELNLDYIGSQFKSLYQELVHN